MRGASRSGDFSLVVWFIVSSVPATVLAQDCNSSLNVDPSKSVTLKAWDGSDAEVFMGCPDAESFRAQIFVTQLAFLSTAQSATAAAVNDNIFTAVDQLNQLRMNLSNAQTDVDVQVISATIKSMQWVASKAKLLICALEGIESGGLALVACAKPVLAFIKDTSSTFNAFSSVSDAQAKAAQVQQLIAALQGEIDQLGSTTIDGSVTAQRYSTVFNSMCEQVKSSCLVSVANERARTERICQLAMLSGLLIR